jgi:hypothetical protein
MNSQLKTIGLTALATTLFWAAAIALVFWLSPKRDDRIQAQFLTDKGSFGMFDSTNTKTQAVTLLLEELPTGADATGRVELVRRELAPGQRLRVGYRELMGRSQ